VGLYHLTLVELFHPKLEIDSKGFYCGFGGFISPLSTVMVNKSEFEALRDGLNGFFYK
jgi:hypothetical protein